MSMKIRSHNAYYSSANNVRIVAIVFSVIVCNNSLSRVSVEGMNIGAPNRIEIRRGRGKICLSGNASSDPRIPTGIIGACVRDANNAAPDFIPLALFSKLIPPSGNTHNTCP